MSFAALGARYPDAGGVATYARLAFGDRAVYLVYPALVAGGALIYHQVSKRPAGLPVPASDRHVECDR